ncbi:MAG: DNA-binding protein [Alphaproteobacteria bacterium]|nr:DNA-binding protein [Alphaproteobacteria bacterium]
MRLPFFYPLKPPWGTAVYIGVKINTLAVWRMTNRYGLPFVKLVKVVRYRKADLDIRLENRLQNSSKD